MWLQTAIFSPPKHSLAHFFLLLNKVTVSSERQSVQGAQRLSSNLEA